MSDEDEEIDLVIDGVENGKDKPVDTPPAEIKLVCMHVCIFIYFSILMVV